VAFAISGRLRSAWTRLAPGARHGGLHGRLPAVSGPPCTRLPAGPGWPPAGPLRPLGADPASRSARGTTIPLWSTPAVMATRGSAANFTISILLPFAFLIIIRVR